MTSNPTVFIPHGSPWHAPSKDCVYCEVSRLSAEIERLRAALEQIRDKGTFGHPEGRDALHYYMQGWSDAADIAREALRPADETAGERK